MDYSPCKDPLRAVQGEAGLGGQEKSPKFLQQSSGGHRADEGRRSGDGTKQEASESLGPHRASRGPA